MKKILAAIAMVVVGTAYADPIVTDSTSRSTTNSTSETTIKSPPPTAVAPAITTINNDVCAVAASGAVQTQILGISMGGTMRDMNCERIKLSKNLYDMGMKVAAVATLCQDERVFAAMLAAGTPCPIDGKIGERAKEEWKTRGVLDKVEKSEVGNYAIPAPPPSPVVETKPVQETNRGSLSLGCPGYTGSDPIVRERVCK